MTDSKPTLVNLQKKSFVLSAITESYAPYSSTLAKVSFERTGRYHSHMEGTSPSVDHHYFHHHHQQAVNLNVVILTKDMFDDCVDYSQ